MAKIATITNVLERRIIRGDYALRDLPTENELASEVGVSRMTARRAFTKLIESGLVVRKPYGKLTVNDEHRSRATHLQVAFLAPRYSSDDFDMWRFHLENACKPIKAHMHLHSYVDWEDPSVSQAFTKFDCVFLIPRMAEPIPDFIVKRMQACAHVVSLSADMTALGIPSLQLLSPVAIHRVADHLYSLGHREIACVNSQPHGGVIDARIEQFNLWKRMYGVTGELLDDPVKPFEHATPRAYDIMKRRLDAGDFTATAVLSITDAATTGILRALQERGLKVPQDISVCGVEAGELPQYQVPSRTALKQPNPEPYLRACLNWIEQNTPWDGPLLVTSNHVELFVGESTGPVRKIE